MKYDQVIVVKSKTRLEQLTERFNTKAQAKFYLERSGDDFSSIEKEHNLFYTAFENLNKLLFSLDKYKVIDRSFLPNYIFTQKDLVIGIGQDGLIANIAKYVKGQPIVGYNPNPSLYDGILLPYPSIGTKELNNIINGDFNSSKVTMAKASFSDGQELLAFNDLFIGSKSHTSSRYTIHFNDEIEQQSSSGIIVCTGVGSTGWMSSISNMVNGIGKNNVSMAFESESNQLRFAVREPFVSKISSANICEGTIGLDQKLIIESNMVNNGLVFSDGIENDFIDFNMGTSVEVSIASEKANLVQR
mmetsp:Transcript_38737/g.50740  ORF Transcript_38737/g.50740 Transcript_38737/m.50740 type:complete len:302 (-) Transcript_38737:324-1229(-)